MIIVKIQGGLGNQFFQYAYARALSERYKTPFKLDIRNYDFENADDDAPDKKFKRGYGIGRYNTIENIATKKEIEPFLKYRKRKGRIWYPYNKLIANSSIYIEEAQYHYSHSYAHPQRLEKGKSVYLDGFWQTEKYFKDIETAIRREFTLKNAPEGKNKETIKKMESSESVCLHVRRGNFLIPEYRKHHGICSLDYYEKAIAEIVKRVQNPHFFIFSDDHAWVKENIKLPFPTTYVDHNGSDKDYEDLRLMNSCKHHIIANSSFSWWGAWLSKNKDQIVAYPSQIFKKKWNLKDFAPEKWIKIETELI